MSAEKQEKEHVTVQMVFYLKITTEVNASLSGAPGGRRFPERTGSRSY